MNTFYLKIFTLIFTFGFYGRATAHEHQIEQTRQYIKFQHDTRCALFNNDIDNPGIAQCRHAIDTILGNEKNVRQIAMTKYDLQKHQETLLSSVMAKIFIAYTGAEQKKGASVYDKRRTVIDPVLLKHFEILRLTEDLSFSFSAQVTNDGVFNRGAMRHLIAGDYEQIFIYSGLSKEIFLSWFETIFKTHNPGFIAKNPQYGIILDGRRGYSSASGGMIEISDDADDELRQAIALSLEGQGVAVGASHAFAVQEEFDDTAPLSAIFSPAEIEELRRAQENYEQQQRDTAMVLALLQEEQDAQAAQARLPAEQYVAMHNVAHVAEGGEDDDLRMALDASFEETAAKAREKITIFPVPSFDRYAGTFVVVVGHLLNAVYDLNDETEERKEDEGKFVRISGAVWKITNPGEFIGNFTGIPDYESKIKPTAVDKAPDGLVRLTYTFRKENGELVTLKLQESKKLKESKPTANL